MAIKVSFIAQNCPSPTSKHSVTEVRKTCLLGGNNPDSKWTREGQTDRKLSKSFEKYVELNKNMSLVHLYFFKLPTKSRPLLQRCYVKLVVLKKEEGQIHMCYLLLSAASLCPL